MESSPADAGKATSTRTRDALYVQTRAGAKDCIIAGGAKENDAARIKGFSLGMWVPSEANAVLSEL
jgi:hypothetical protein